MAGVHLTIFQDKYLVSLLPLSLKVWFSVFRVKDDSVFLKFKKSLSAFSHCETFLRCWFTFSASSSSDLLEIKKFVSSAKRSIFLDHLHIVEKGGVLNHNSAEPLLELASKYNLYYIMNA